jgi:hypothetical protein
MATATFTADNHRYAVDGVAVPSVTQVLAISGLDDTTGIPLHYLERAAGIGSAVHKACHFLDEEDLELESLDPLIQGYVLAYQRFRAENNFEIELIEHRTIANVDGLAYGMCVDRLGKLDGRTTVLELKTASKAQKWWGVQTAAYAVGLSDRYDFPGLERVALHLAKDGTCKLIRHEDDGDYEVWWAALRVAHWQLGNGRRKAA